MINLPLIRTRYSNEKVMTGLFLVLILFMIPHWIKFPGLIFNFIISVSIGLFFDVLFNFFRYKKILCAVSAAVTAGIINVIFYDVSIFWLITGTVISIAVIKHAFGGTGQNVLNPAVFGILLLYPFCQINQDMFIMLSIPAMIVSLLFQKFRPYASSGMILGMLISMFLQNGLNLPNIIYYGVFFWATVIITDPVTVTPNPLIGFFLAFISGFISMINFYTGNSYILFLCTSILIINVISSILEEYEKDNKYVPGSLCIKKFALMKNKNDMLNFSEKNHRESDINVKLSEEMIMEKIQNGEIYGLGGGGFPLIKKIRLLEELDIKEKYIIINGIECDPGLNHDRWILENFPDKINSGIMLLEKILPKCRIYLALKNKVKYDFDEKIKIKILPDLYPIGAEKKLIFEILQIKLTHKEFPAEHGILVINIQTVLAVFEAVMLNKKSTSKYLTLTNLNNKETKILYADNEQKIFDVIDKIYPDETRRYSGGGIMNCHSVDENDIIDKKTNFIAVGNPPYFKESIQCSKCSFCNLYCPSGINVRKINDYVEKGNIEKTLELTPEKCIECGICSFVCLAGRNLAERVRKAKNEFKREET